MGGRKDNIMKYGYIRVSSKDQNFDRQFDILKPYGCEQTYMEKVSGKNTKDRPEFQALLKTVVEGDEIYVTELSRFARSVRDLAAIVEELNEKGVRLFSVKEGFDLSTSTGRMMCHIIGAVAQFERENIAERQAQGIAAAKARGKRWGAVKRYGLDEEKMDWLFAMYYAGKCDLETALVKAEMKQSTFFAQYKKWRVEHGIERDLRRKDYREEVFEDDIE